MRRADGGQRLHAVSHAEFGDHVASIQAAHAVRPGCGPARWPPSIQEAFELCGSLGYPVGHPQARSTRGCPLYRETGDAGKITGDGPAAQLQLVKAEQAVNQNQG